MGAERDDRDPVAWRLASDEGAGGGNRVEQRATGHGAGPVDREHDALGPSEVLRRETGNGLAVLGQRRPRASRPGGDNGRTDGRVSANLDATKRDLRGCAPRGDERGEHGG